MPTGLFTHPSCQLHEMGAGHPESPERLQAIDDQLIASRIDALLSHRHAPPATEAELRRVHSAAAIALLRDQIPAAGGYLQVDPDTYLNHFSWHAALHAAGAAIAATNAVLDGELDNAFCAIRPPGHHARPSTPMGFCLLNNLAIAARHALARGLERVAIIDFDVHHGNGTAEAFADDAQVLMVSFFQHPLYPYSGTTTAEQAQKNFVNCPLPAGSDGAAVREVVTQHWLPALHRQQPQMLFISAGFDAHREDPLGNMQLVEADYAWLTEQIMAVAQQHAHGRIVSCLEGGYNLSALGRSVAAHLKVLAGAA